MIRKFFFSNIVKNSNFSRYSDSDSATENKAEPTPRAILMYKYYPNIFAIHSQCEVKTFCFVEFDTKYIKNKIIKLNDNKIPQVLDILEVNKENIYIFTFKSPLFPSNFVEATVCFPKRL